MPRPAKKSESSKPSRAELAALYVTQKKLGKDGYKLSDLAMDQLEQIMKPGQTVKLADGRTFRLVDTWEGKSRVNTGMNVRKYDLEVISAP